MTRPLRHRTVTTQALWLIETRLSGDTDLATLAAACGVSPTHLIRAFRESAGLSPMAYQRARRLSEAAKALIRRRGDILGVALDAGYGSHEAFTRAFSAEFGCAPSQVRSADDLSRLTLTEPLHMTDPTPITLAAPALKTRDAFEVTGLDAQFTFGTIPQIPALWAAFTEREDEVTASPPGLAFGISHSVGEDGFRYMAAYPTAPGVPVPQGMTRLHIPAGRYAVWDHRGHVSDLHRTMRAIFDTGLGAAGLTARAAPELELYDTRFDPATGSGTVELWIPVE